MKFALTGHTKGIGKGLYDKLIKDGHTVSGFSRSNGYDISKKYLDILKESKDCDCFVNNAYCGDSQKTLFDLIYEMWKKDSTKTIINILSKSRYTEFNGINSKYSNDKKNLYKDAMSRIFDDARKCRIINISLGMADTNFNFSDSDTNNKLNVEECVNIILYAAYMPKGIEIGDIGFWKIPRIKEI